MIKHTAVELSVLYEAGKSYNWIRPPCPNGCIKVWGHGFVSRYFEGFSNCFWVKRYRCPSCKAVITLLPKGFFSRYQSSTRQIYDSLTVKLKTLRWPSACPRQRGGHWLRKFMAKLIMDFPGSSPPELLDRLFSKMLNFLS